MQKQEGKHPAQSSYCMCISNSTLFNAGDKALFSDSWLLDLMPQKKAAAADSSIEADASAAKTSCGRGSGRVWHLGPVTDDEGMRIVAADKAKADEKQQAKEKHQADKAERHAKRAKLGYDLVHVQKKDIARMTGDELIIIAAHYNLKFPVGCTKVKERKDHLASQIQTKIQDSC